MPAVTASRATTVQPFRSRRAGTGITTAHSLPSDSPRERTSAPQEAQMLVPVITVVFSTSIVVRAVRDGVATGADRRVLLAPAVIAISPDHQERKDTTVTMNRRVFALLALAALGAAAGHAPIRETPASSAASARPGSALVKRPAAPIRPGASPPAIIRPL